jgi:GH15 family glucan-1,4-alpha-glucosidase
VPIEAEGAYPPIEHYAIIGDCRTAALVSRDGSIDWLCLPDFSSPAVFAGILDRARGGCFSIRPAGKFAVERRYLGSSAVLETTFRTDGGVVRLLDALPVLDGVESLDPMREILRVIEGVSGEVDLAIRLDPRPDYGRIRLHPRHRGRLGWCYGWSNEILLVESEAELDCSERVLCGSVIVKAGERSRFSLSYTKGDPGIVLPLGRAAEERIERTLAWWRSWTGACTYEGPHRDAVLRSAVTLKLLSFALSGAIVAAPTTSLPEAIGGERNWDYRYCWLRDAGLTMTALTELGFQDEARAFLSWLLHATRLTWPELRVLYDVYGRTKLDERQLDRLHGYRGSRPVRVGNGAYAQLQLDAYGQVLLAADAFRSAGGKLEPVEGRMLAGFGKVVAKRWREPDHGIWEIPGRPRHYTLSKAMCWLAFDCLLTLHEEGDVRLRQRDCEHFRRERQAIADAIESKAFNADLDSYASELDGGDVDASLLLLPSLRYIDAADPRMISTYERVRARLGRNGLLYRYEPGYDDLDSAEGAFGICGFWAVENLARRGNLREAERAFEHLLSFANDLGLFSEESDPQTGAALGNFPQAFTHVGLINAAVAIEKARHSRR